MINGFKGSKSRALTTEIRINLFKYSHNDKKLIFYYLRIDEYMISIRSLSIDSLRMGKIDIKEFG